MHLVRQSVKVIDLSLPSAAGSINPATRIHTGELKEGELQEFLKNVGNFFTKLPVKGSIPAQCVDGRSRTDGTYEPEAKAAAGTFSAVVGDALTNASFKAVQDSAADHARRIYIFLRHNGYKIGGHDADHAAAGGCGCGAEDNLGKILEFISRNGEEIRKFLQNLDLEISDSLNDLIESRAKELIQEGYVVSGEALRDAYVTVADRASVETLTGPHNEVALVINTHPGTTIDRVVLANTYRNRLQVFELDVPSLQHTAKILSLSNDEAHAKFIAMLYYNVATASILADSSVMVAVS